ncbi:hypothetical protein [Pseudoflavonifractor capillosus]|uniref:hypothetical protein n=1 Tax=Pseudoflavonifractor capillosus TaxID=106588 RepID=UPI0019581CBF|nr:hypothetical protein [Pseudoflavonifractor capillosus]MBM6680061.1 hypothetical protein [Pseudoflavonifractor capillosus]
MIEIKITGATPTEALISLAAMGLHCQADPLIDTAARQLLASGGGSAEAVVSKVPKNPSIPAAPAAPASALAPAPVAAPVVPAPAPAAPAAPVAPGPTAAPGSMPAAATPAPAYTQEQLSKAGVELVSTDPAKMTALSSLLAQYGVQAITQLAPAQYGAFATALRGLGARI